MKGSDQYLLSLLLLLLKLLLLFYNNNNNNNNNYKGASSWLNAVPLADQGLALNKQEFRDSLR